MRVGEYKLRQFMQEISNILKLEVRYTNHCVRVTGATNLTRANFTANQIMLITGHKSVNSLAMYQRVKSDEKMMMGISLAYNLFQQNVQNVPAVPQQLALPPLIQIEEENHDKALATPDLLPMTAQKVETAVTPYSKPQEEPQMADTFDILDFITEASDEEVLMAATQMEKNFQEEKK